MVVAAGADETEIDAVAFGAFAEQREHVHLAAALRHVLQRAGAQRFGDFVEQVFDGADADGL